jgi:hypothetical protein
MSKIPAKRSYWLVNGESRLECHRSEWDKDKWIFYPLPKDDSIPPPIFVNREDGVGERGWTLEF